MQPTAHEPESGMESIRNVSSERPLSQCARLKMQ